VAASGVAGLDCPNCGAAITIRALQQTQTVVCPSCHAVLDSKDQQLSVLQQYQAKMRFAPEIPLGTRGTLRGDMYEVGGFQVRSVRQDQTEYFWRVYTLWNPYQGYRHLLEYDGHWCDFAVSRIAPSEMVSGRQPYVTFDSATFQHYRTTTVTTEFILGEFPWEIHSGDRCTMREFIAPPRMLFEEVTSGATVWTLGHYLEPGVVAHAFDLADAPLPPKGVFPCESNPYPVRGGRRLRWAAAAAIPIVAALLLRRVWESYSAVLTSPWPYVLLLAACAAPPFLDGRHAWRFERDRWAASDYAPDET
jgi:Domain of unknown function (DUF4178)